MLQMYMNSLVDLLLSKMGKILLFTLFFTITLHGYCKDFTYLQDDSASISDNVKISLLTCSPGDELYTSYGHSAIHIFDRNLNVDVVFNYGTFDFRTPYFYLKFLNGTLDYMLSASDYRRFLCTYEREQRGVVERELLLSSSEKIEIEKLLIENSRPENKFYRYDFFFDNCATRIRDLVYRVKGISGIPVPDGERDNQSFRDCIHSFVGPNEWSGFGIDLILGVRADIVTSQYERAMLPDYLEELLVEQHLVGDKKVVLNRQEKILTDSSDFNITPNLAASLFFLLTLSLGILEWRRGLWLRWYDITISLVMSILSIIFVYLWFVSEIKITSYNYNVLWASVLYIPMVVVIAKRGMPIIRKLAVLNTTLLGLYFLIAIFRIQYASLPIILIALTMLFWNVKLLYRVK